MNLFSLKNWFVDKKLHFFNYKVFYISCAPRTVGQCRKIYHLPLMLVNEGMKEMVL